MGFRRASRLPEWVDLSLPRFLQRWVCVEGKGAPHKHTNPPTPGALPGLLGELWRPGGPRDPSRPCRPAPEPPLTLGPSPAPSPQGAAPGTRPQARVQRPGGGSRGPATPRRAQALLPGRHFGSLFTFAARRSPATWLSPRLTAPAARRASRPPPGRARRQIPPGRVRAATLTIWG